MGLGLVHIGKARMLEFPSLSLFSFIHSFIHSFIYLFRGRGQRERERIPSRLCAVSAESDIGFDPMNCEIMTYLSQNQELDAQ